MAETRSERLSLRLTPTTRAEIQSVATDLSALAPRALGESAAAEYLLHLGARAYQRGERLGAQAGKAPKKARRRRAA